MTIGSKNPLQISISFSAPLEMLGHRVHLDPNRSKTEEVSIPEGDYKVNSSSAPIVYLNYRPIKGHRGTEWTKVELESTDDRIYRTALPSLEDGISEDLKNVNLVVEFPWTATYEKDSMITTVGNYTIRIMMGQVFREFDRSAHPTLSEISYDIEQNLAPPFIISAAKNLVPRVEENETVAILYPSCKLHHTVMYQSSSCEQKTHNPTPDTGSIKPKPRRKPYTCYSYLGLTRAPLKSCR